MDLRHVVDRLADLYTPEETQFWLEMGHPMLNGKRPIDLINAGHMQKVLALIESVEEGAYT